MAVNAADRQGPEHLEQTDEHLGPALVVGPPMSDAGEDQADGAVQPVVPRAAECRSGTSRAAEDDDEQDRGAIFTGVSTSATRPVGDPRPAPQLAGPQDAGQVVPARFHQPSDVRRPAGDHEPVAGRDGRGRGRRRASISGAPAAGRWANRTVPECLVGLRHRAADQRRVGGGPQPRPPAAPRRPPGRRPARPRSGPSAPAAGRTGPTHSRR